MEFWSHGVMGPVFGSISPALHFSNTPSSSVFVLCWFRWLLLSLNHQLSTAANWLPRLVLLQILRCQRACLRAPRFGAPSRPLLIMQRGSGKVVARKGSAPPISGCRPDVILFHHRAEIGCRGWNRTSIHAFKGRSPTIRRPGKWWPAGVTLPVPRIKSPLHHFNACRPKWCSRQGLHLHWRRSRRRVSAIGLRERRKSLRFR